MWPRFGRNAGWVVVVWSVLLGVAAAEDGTSAQGASGRRLGEAEPPALSPQQSLLLKVKTRLHDPLDSLASWTPWFGPCDEGGDSFEDGWEFVKCDGGTATQLYLAGAQGVSGDLTTFLWPLRQSGIKEIYLPPLERIAADGERTVVIHDKAEHERIVAAEQAEQARLAAEKAEQERIAAEEAAAAAGDP